MKTTRRVMTGLFGALLACGTLMAVTMPGATAATPTVAGAQAVTLAPPTLTSVTKDGDNMFVVWKPSSSTGVKDYVFMADGRQVLRMSPAETDPEDRGFIAVASEGLTGNETYTLAAEDSAGDLS